MNTKHTVDIRIKTIRMKLPDKIDGKTERKSFLNDDEMNAFIEREAFLRKSAYSNTTINVDESFFDDSDMRSEYHLVVVYEKHTGTPLLSSRYYFNKSVIEKCLKGDNNEGIKLVFKGREFDLSGYEEGAVFLADRLSGNVEDTIYQQYRTEIFGLFHSEIAAQNKTSALLLMVRKEPEDRQLSKYLSLGFSLIGSTFHKGKEHSIVLIDLKTV